MMSSQLAVEDPSIQSKKKRGEDEPAAATIGCDADILIQNLRTSFPLFVADVTGLACGCCLAVLFQRTVGAGIELNAIKLFLGTSAAFTVAYYLFDLYPGVGLTAVSEFRMTAIASTIVFSGIAAAWFIGPPGDEQAPLTALLILWLVTLTAIPIFRSFVRSICARYDWWSQPVLIVGGRDRSRAVIDAVRNDPRSGLRPVGVVYHSDQDRFSLDLAHGRKSSVRDLAQLRRRLSAHRAIVMSDCPSLDQFVSPGLGVPHIHVVSNRSEAPALWASVGERAGLPEIQLKDCLLLPVARLSKRLMDVIAILLATPLLVPVFCVLAAIVKISSVGPVFYSQRRLGMSGRHFHVWKFRTMVANADQVLQECLDANPSLKTEWDRDHKLKNDPRITAIGTLLRKTSLDELPQLWNVLVGDMSLVGPRPIVDAEIAKYGDVYAMYKQVLPGITGIWQISGRNNTTYEERLKFDRYYVKNWSPWLDAYILLRTVTTVLLREGAY